MEHEITIEQKYKYVTAEENIVNTDWAAGSRKQITNEEIICELKNGAPILTIKEVTYSPAWYKIIDEPIVNALDQYTRYQDTSTPVNKIRIDFERSGRVKIFNSGPGIEIKIHSEASKILGYNCYVPTFIFGMLYQGSNNSDNADSDFIGGVNGLGAKLTNCFASEFIVETNDGVNYFRQIWRDRKSQVFDPKIINLNSTEGKKLPLIKRAQHTQIEFMPDYVGLFEYNNDGNLFTDEEYNDLNNLLRARAYMAALFANKATLTFNSEVLNVKCCKDLASLFQINDESIIAGNMKLIVPNKDPIVWSICAFPSLENSTHTTNSRNKQKICAANLSNINGVFVRGGKHFNYVNAQIAEGIQPKINKSYGNLNFKITPNLVSQHLHLIINAKIPKKLVAWTGQRKDILDTDPKKFIGIKFQGDFINQVAALLHDKIIDMMAAQTKKLKKPKRAALTVSYDKYIPAKKAGTKQSAKCILIPVEGDSVISRICTGISNNMGFEYFGIISMRGVIINARRHTKKIQTAKKLHITLSEKLSKNEFFKLFCTVTGLSLDYKYDRASASYQKEMATLNYGLIVACVDQDLDGKGKILGLLLSMFEVFWPNLLNAGYLRWFCTPIIRAYPKLGGKVKPFYCISDFEKWLSDNGSDKIGANYDVRYYKGIGSHDRTETIHMFKLFHEFVYAYYLDSKSADLFQVYFGDDPDLRKKILGAPPTICNDKFLSKSFKTKKISCSDHLSFETDLYQRDDLSRKHDHIIDGQNQAGRKILDGILKAFAKNNKKMRVAQLAGEISKIENYHHGEDSLNKSITNRGFVATGGKQLPFLIPLSNFGSRINGGKDASPPRYIDTRLNVNITKWLFPRDDYWLLEFNFDENKRSEPKYFVPILPLATLESGELPSHGWKLELWARDVRYVIKNVRLMIERGPDTQLFYMPPCVYRNSIYEWRGTFEHIRGDIYSIGKYHIEMKGAKTIVRITELPLRVWTAPYLNALNKKMETTDYIYSIDSVSNDTQVDISVTLRPGALEKISEFADGEWSDGIIKFFNLRQRMVDHINLMGINNEIISCDNYEEILRIWFPVRRDFYIRRVERLSTILKLRVIYQKNILRYLGVNYPVDKNNGDKIQPIIWQKNKNGRPPKVSEMNAILESKKFDKFNVALLNMPKFIATEMIEENILRGPKSTYNYLLDISDRHRSEESIEGFKKALDRAINDENDFTAKSKLGPFPGALIWLDELENLEAEINEGMRTAWRYGENDKYIYD